MPAALARSVNLLVVDPLGLDKKIKRGHADQAELKEKHAQDRALKRALSRNR